MDVRLSRRRQVERIERRIARLSRRAEALFECERKSEQTVARGGRRRSERRAQRRLERLQAERAKLVEVEVRAIMLALQRESVRMRERLDRELERMAPLEREWDRLGSLFGALEETIAAPALDQLTEQWQGGLQIPDFPVVEQTGYIKPFPPKAILF